MLKLLIRILLLFCITAGVILISTYSDTIRSIISRQFGMYQGQVAGTRTSLEQEIKTNLQETTKDAQRQILQFKVEDVLHFFGRAGKIGTDIMQLKDELLNKVAGER